MAVVCLGLLTILARSGEEAGAMLSEGGLNGLLLDAPQEFGPLLGELVEGRPLGEVEEEIREQLGGLSEGWLHRFRGILESMEGLGHGAPMPICVGTLGEERRMLEDKMTTSLLEYRGMAGRMAVSDWRRQMDQVGRGLRTSLEKQLGRVLVEIGDGGRWLWVSGIHARGADAVLASEGHSCRVVLLGKPYLGTPLEALQAELAEGRATDDRVLYLVQLHLEFLREYVMASPDLDEAYDAWLAAGEWARLYHLRDPA